MADISPVALEILHGHLTTQARWSVTVGEARYYREERLVLHRKIGKAIGKDTAKRQSPRALVIAGGPASGKSTILSSLDLPTRAVHLDADAIKAQLPEFQELQRRGEPQAAWVVHEESADVARTILFETLARSRHLILDVVGDSEAGKFVGKLELLRDAGYRVDIVYVDVGVDEAIRRAGARERLVPEAVVRHMHREVAARFSEVEALDWLASLRIFATDTGEPLLVAEQASDGSLDVHEAARLEEFRQKADA